MLAGMNSRMVPASRPMRGLLATQPRRRSISSTRPRSVAPTSLAPTAAEPRVIAGHTLVELTPTRKLFYHLLNPELAADREVLDSATAYMEAAHASTAKDIFGSHKAEYELYQPFDYSEDALDERLDLIYKALAQESNSYDPSTDPVFTSKERVQERLRQYSPNNLTDGAWLTGIALLPGTKTRVQCLLLHILEDEHGNGDPALNHANVYRDTLQSQDIYLPDVGSEEFARHPQLWEEAFELPVYMLATAKFPVTCFAYTLGITLAFEWTAISLTATVNLLRHFGIDDHFYKLHKGIDNPITGHGAWAVEAVKLHLADVLTTQGKAAQQAAWQKIWLGYVTFTTFGGLDAALQRLHKVVPKSLHDQMVDMIRSKQYASMSHDHAFLDQAGKHHVRDMFKDPDAFVHMLAANSVLVVPGKPDESRIIQDMTFTGPMFRVFTEKEQQLFRDWITSLAHPAQPSSLQPAQPSVPQPAVQPLHTNVALASAERSRALDATAGVAAGGNGVANMDGLKNLVLPRQAK